MRLFLGNFVQLYDYVSLKHSFSFLEAKWVKKRNLHITFLFLGEVKEPATIIEKIQGIDYPKIQIPIKGLGYFGSPPKIFYARAEHQAIHDLHAQILQRLDYSEDELFIPHVTLCRIKRIKDQDRFIKQLRLMQNRSFGTAPLKLQLIKSTLTPKGPIYEPIATF